MTRATILEQPNIDNILAHLGLHARASFGPPTFSASHQRRLKVKLEEIRAMLTGAG
jgi:hypothetical protein